MEGDQSLSRKRRINSSELYEDWHNRRIQQEVVASPSPRQLTLQPTQTVDKLMDIIQTHTGLKLLKTEDSLQTAGQWHALKSPSSQEPDGRIHISLADDSDVDTILTVLDGRAIEIGGDMLAVEVANENIDAPPGNSSFSQRNQGNGRRRRMTRGSASALAAS